MVVVSIIVIMSSVIILKFILMSIVVLNLKGSCKNVNFKVM